MSEWNMDNDGDASFSVADCFSGGEYDEVIIVSEPEETYGRSSSKPAFIQWLSLRCKQAAIAVLDLMESTGNSPGLNVIRYQIIKSATSTSANYRAACRARSKREFFAKMSITVEECDETIHWLEILSESKVKVDKEAVKAMIPEWTEILKIFSKARSNAYRS